MNGKNPGAFLVLEGPDGSGKTTQAALLAKWLRDLGRDVVSCREPGGTALGERLRSIVMDRSETAIGLRAEMLLYMTSRAQLVEEIIRPALAAGNVVVSDRFLLSNVVYQGYAGGLEVSEVWAVGHAATGGVVPDLTLLVDVPEDIAEIRIGAPRDRIEDRPRSYRERVRQGFLEALAIYPGPSCLIDGSDSPEVVASRIQSEVSRALGIGSRS